MQERTRKQIYSGPYHATKLREGKTKKSWERVIALARKAGQNAVEEWLGDGGREQQQEQPLEANL